jgi:hypothetical protein
MGMLKKSDHGNEPDFPMSCAQGERKSGKKRTDKKRIHRRRANAVEHNRARIAWRGDHAYHVTGLNGKIQLIGLDEESAGIQARPGWYKSREIVQASVFEDALRG